MKKGRKGKLNDSLPKKGSVGRGTEKREIKKPNLISKILFAKKYGEMELENEQDDDELLNEIMDDEDIEEEYDENFLELLKKTFKIKKER